MSTTVIIEGDESLLTRDRRFVCPFCDTVFIADSESYTLATFKEQADYGVVAFATCPTCSQDAVSPVGSGGEVQTPVALVVKTLPAKTAYRPGEKFVTTGLVLGMKFTDGSIGTVDLADCTFDPSTSDTLTAAVTKVTVTHTPTELEIDIPIAVRNQAIPWVELVSDALVYNGYAQSVKVRNYDSRTSTATGNSKTNAGEYTAKFTPRTGYCWPNGSTSALDITWHIAKATPSVSTPSAYTNLVYTGEAQNVTTASSPLIAGTTNYYGYRPAGSQTIEWSTNRFKFRTAGTYHMFWRLDGGTNHESISATFIGDAIIHKAVPTVTLGTDTMTLTDIATPGTSTVNVGVSDGAVSVTSSDETVCTASYSNGVVTVTAVADGTATVTVSAAGTRNCEAASATIAVTVAIV